MFDGDLSFVKMQPSARLILREMEPSDWRFVHDIRGPDIPARSASERFAAATKQWVQAMIRRRSKSPRMFFRFVIVLRQSETPIGWCDLYRNEERLDVVEVGFRVDDRFAGCGYATEACASAVDFAFARLYARVIWAECERTNYGAARVLDKVGFAQQGDACGLTEMEDALYYELRREQWVAMFTQAKSGHV